MSTQKLDIRIETRSPKQQRDVASVLKELQRDFPELDIKIEPESKRLVPGEVVLVVGVTIISKVLAEVVLRFLDKLWGRLRDKDISPILSSLDSVRSKAEGYLLSMGITDFETVKREDRGLYALFVFKVKGRAYRIYISRSDLRIIKYEKVES